MSEYRLNPQKVRAMLKNNYIGNKIYFFDSTTSTFDEAEKIKKENGTVIYASHQTNGRGRLGRQWQSEDGGIYFSVILTSDANNDKLQIITALCAVAIHKAISELIPCKIKWPNDIVSSSGKKICGILTKVQADSDRLYINMGIGINANTDRFESSLAYASSIKLLTGNETDETRLFCRCLEEIEKALDISAFDSTMEYFKNQCITLGSRVKIIYTSNSDYDTGLCTGIANDGSLMIKKDNGTVINVNSGEVSVRGIYGEEYI